MPAISSAVVIALILVTAAPASGQFMYDTAQTALRPDGAPAYGDVALRYGWVRSSFPTVTDAQNAIRDFHATRVDWFYPGSHAADIGNTYVSTDGQGFIDWTQTNNMKIVGAMNTNTTNLAWRLTDGPSGRYIGDPGNSAYTQEAVNWGKAQVDAGVDAIVIDDFFYYNASQQQQFNNNVIAPIKAYSVSQGYTGGIKIAGNNGSSIGTQYVSNYDFDFHYSDNNFTPGPGAMWQASKDHRAQQSAFLMHPNRPMTVDERRTLIGLGYGVGAHVIAPWDEYTSSAAGGGRLFESPSDFADIFGFARALDAQGYLNGYEDAAVGGFDLIENRYGTETPIEVASGSGSLSVFGRAKPGEANASIVFHLVESGTGQASTLRLKRDALYDLDNVGFSLFAPTAYDATLHANVATHGNYEALAQSTSLNYYLDGDDLVVELPPVANQWNMLLATANDGTPSPAPQPFIGTVAYWQLDETSGNLIDVAGGSQTLTGGSGLTYGVPSIAPDPLPNPDVGPFINGTTEDNPSAVRFNGSGEAPSFASDDFKITNDTSFTFEGWLQHNITDGTQSGLEMIAGDRHAGSTAADGNGSFNGWVVWVENGRLAFYSQFGPNADPITGKALSTTHIDDENVYHFAAVWDHVNGEMRLYIDGILEDTALLTPGEYLPSAFVVGGRATSSDNVYNDNILNGVLDELRFSNQAMAPWQFTNAIPEPASLAMVLLGLTLVMTRRRGRAQ